MSKSLERDLWINTFPLNIHLEMAVHFCKRSVAKVHPFYNSLLARFSFPYAIRGVFSPWFESCFQVKLLSDWPLFFLLLQRNFLTWTTSLTPTYSAAFESSHKCFILIYHFFSKIHLSQQIIILFFIHTLECEKKRVGNDKIEKTCSTWRHR